MWRVAGSAFLFGHSSGGSRTLKAARNLGANVAKVAVYEAPHNDDPAAQEAWASTSVTSPRHWRMAGEGDAVEWFMRCGGISAKGFRGQLPNSSARINRN